MKQLKLFAFTLLIFCGVLFSSSTAQGQAGYALTVFDYDVDAGIVIGTSQTYLNPALDPYYNVGVDGYLIKYNDPYLQTYTILDSGSVNHSNNAIVITEANVQRGEIYAVFSDHWLQTAYYVGGYAYDPYGLFYSFGQTTNPYYGFLQGSPGYVYNVWIYLGRTGVIVWLPNITQLAPDAGLPGTTPLVQIAGKYIGEHSGVLPTITVSGSGVTAQAQQTYPGGVEAAFQIAEDADIGNHSVRLYADSVPSNLVTFRVGDRTPVISSISPPTGNTGQNVSVTISGSDFGLNPQVQIDGTGVNPTITSATSTQINAVFSIADITYIGNRNVKVKSNGRSGGGFIPGPGNSDTSNAVGFNVTDPTVNITEDGIVEKYGERTVKVTVQGLANPNDTTKLKLRTISGTGDARFASNNSYEFTITGNVTNQPVIIKGVTESSQANNITIEATFNNDTVVKAHKEFTVATISSLAFERFDSTYTQIDNNPGNGVSGSAIGQRIFPDRLTPTETTDRSLVKVKATISPAIQYVQVYFSNYDMDDPSANAPPIDTTSYDGNDNNGSVMIGSTPSKAGQLSVDPSLRHCSESVGKANCVTGADGTVTVQFKTTMQPGDNFAVAASLSEAYRDQIRVLSVDGRVLVDNTGINEIHISGEANPDNTPGIRTQMLTVWRRLHIEVDSMGNVGNGNNVTGTTSGAVTIPAGGVGNVTVTTTSPLEDRRFQLGRLVVNNMQFSVLSNTANTSEIYNNYRQPKTISNGASFTLYDDDDYNADDTTFFNGQITRNDVDGDNNEPIVQLPDSFIHLSDGSIIGGDNILGSAYILPNYQWASQYNNNVPFDLNVEVTESGATTPTSLLNANRGSQLSERDDFWVAYFLVAYQGPLLEDADGNIGNNPEGGTSGITTSYSLCDCYQSSSCPGTACTVLPRGGFGSLIYQETMQDVHRSWLFANRTFPNIETTAPHELGHQFGLLGDVVRTTFKIMDYSDYRNNVVNEVGFHPEHINILRRRVKSPGE
jgi:hypothetical protein